MFKVDYCKVVGFKEMLDIFLLSGENLPGDSYETHIEDPETLETAPHQFVLGEEDLKAICSDKNLLSVFRNGIKVYFHAIGDVNLAGFTSDRAVSYQRIYMCVNGYVGYLGDYSQKTQNDIREWILSLPYAEELGLIEDKEDE